jgi:UDP-N-acetylglucosamine/UDP-N-acetylgalactosamine diphosphorylase
LKTDSNEKVGVMVYKNNLPAVAEYSEISKELSESKDSEGILLYSAANIADHIFHIDFIERVIFNLILPLHAAKKKIPFITRINGNTKENQIPLEENGIKLEMFIFDSFSIAKNIAALVVDRESEFSLIKNAIGTDSPQTALIAYCKNFPDDK